MPLSIRADSTEYVTATITADHDITGRVIEVALPAKSTDPEVWHAAEVLGVDNSVAGKSKATYRLLVGPNGGNVALVAGSYRWLVRLTDTPEQPVRDVDAVTVV